MFLVSSLAFLWRFESLETDTPDYYKYIINDGWSACGVYLQRKLQCSNPYSDADAPRSDATIKTTSRAEHIIWTAFAKT